MATSDTPLGTGATLQAFEDKSISQMQAAEIRIEQFEGKTKQATQVTDRARLIAYRATTGLAALALSAIGAGDLLRVPAIVAGLTHLGYPGYFATILGTWKLLGVAAILAPGLPRLKEWAYAGMFFTLSGAALSHAAMGDPVSKILVPLLLLGAVLVSWALRPAPEAPVAANVRRAENGVWEAVDRNDATR